MAVSELHADVMLKALEHIANVCKGSRQYTRRIRWIEQRARRAMIGNGEWKDLDLPKHDPAVLKLAEMIASVYELAQREIAAIKDMYEDEKGVIVDEEAARVLRTWERFVANARANIESIREFEQQRG